MSRAAHKHKPTLPPLPVIGQNAKNLDDLVAALKDEYLYNTRNLLRTARKAAMRAAKRQLDACGTSAVSHRTPEPETGHFTRFTVEVFDNGGSIVNRKTVSRQAAVLPMVESVPKYKDFNTIRKNHHVKDVDFLSYVPYFGETDDVDLADAYKIDVRTALEEEDLERSKILSRIVGRYLEMNDLTVEQAMSAVKEKIEKEEEEEKERKGKPMKPASQAIIDKLERLNVEWEAKTNLCLNYVLKGLNKDSPLESHQSPVRAMKNPQEAIETYRFLSCPICTMHDCCFHDVDRCDVLPRGEDDSTPYRENEPCSEECYIMRTPEIPMTDTGIWTDEDLGLLDTCVRIQGKSNRICCLAAIGLGKPCDIVYAKLVAKGVIPLTPPTTTTTTTTTVTTTVTTTFSSEQSRPSSSSRQSRSMSIESSTIQQKSRSHVHVHKKRKTGFVKSKSSKREAKTEYPPDCGYSGDNEKRGKFTPCDHEGPCGRECPCVKDQVHCEKECACPPDCPKRWRGCSCKKGGTCGTHYCECIKWGRECDVDLCGSCLAAEVLDPVNLAKERNGEIYEGGCANVSIQRGETKRTMMGRSTISGWGLFAGERVKANQFLGEYKGELIGNEESERRGLIYDQKYISFLFTLNKDQVVDATHAANKFRFVNCSIRNPNCYAKISLVNGVHRIGMYAKTDLYPGQELFFDYGYNSKSTKFVPLEHQAKSNTKVRVKVAGRDTGAKKSKEKKQRVRSLQRVKPDPDEEEEGEETEEMEEESESFEDSEMSS